jgi:hypothetical protein
MEEYIIELGSNKIDDHTVILSFASLWIYLK